MTAPATLFMRARCLKAWAEKMRRDGPPAPLLPSMRAVLAERHEEAIAATEARANAARSAAIVALTEWRDE